MAVEDDVEKLYQKLRADAEGAGYFINPDAEFARELVTGLIANTERYGYPACPCRLASGRKESDTDIICPCDYRDADLEEFGACYCALYVSQEAANGEKSANSIPERRGTEKERQLKKGTDGFAIKGNLSLPVWRCKVCGYLCAREEPPGICPICKAKKERFERFI
jgi:ferredoxin-thioredoxin reductase catalytic subunit